MHVDEVEEAAAARTDGVGVLAAVRVENGGVDAERRGRGRECALDGALEREFGQRGQPEAERRHVRTISVISALYTPRVQGRV